jgi:hypothetical protein
MLSGPKSLWLLALPLLVGASEGAQALLDRVSPASYRGAELLAHGRTVELFVGLSVVAIVLAGYGLVGHLSSGSSATSLPAYSFALVPVALYALQEHVEYWLAHGLGGTPATQTPFLSGLLLQLPFAFAAYAVARLLIRVAARIVHAAPRAPWHRLSPSPPRAPATIWLPSPSLVGGARLSRGPPR